MPPTSPIVTHGPASTDPQNDHFGLYAVAFPYPRLKRQVCLSRALGVVNCSRKKKPDEKGR